MAGLAELDLESMMRKIDLPNGGFFTVRGIAISDISRIVRSNSHDLEGFFMKWAGEQQAIHKSPDPKFAAKGLATKFGKDLLAGAPDLAADIIAHASDEPAMSHRVKMLPFPVQLEALDAIAELTFNGEDGIKKAVEAVIKMLRGATSLAESQNLSEIGTMVSEDNTASS
jgi:hypothetical protein